jgi:hypothetical protein
MMMSGKKMIVAAGMSFRATAARAPGPPRAGGTQTSDRSR